MSNWTHVAGIIRLDSIRIVKEPPNFDWIFGKECLSEAKTEAWEDLNEHPENYLSSGSEGTLQKNIWINPRKNEICAYAVSVFGDLRNHDNPQEIVDWFKEKCNLVEKYGCWVRDAVITVRNEWTETITWAYEN